MPPALVPCLTPTCSLNLSACCLSFSVTHHIDEFKVAAVQCRDNVLSWQKIASGEATLAEDGTVTEVEQPAVEEAAEETAVSTDPAESQP